MYRREKQRGTVRGKFIVLLLREILGGRIFLTVEGPPGKTLLKKRHKKHVQEGKTKTKRYCTRHVYRPLEPRNSERTHFPYCRAPPGKTVLKKRHKKHVQEEKTKRYCTRHVYRLLAPRNSGRTHFPYYRSASRQNAVQEKTQKICTGRKNKEVPYAANLSSSRIAKFWADAFCLLL